MIGAEAVAIAHSNPEIMVEVPSKLSAGMAVLARKVGAPEPVAKPHRHFLLVTMTQTNWKRATNIWI